jgi:rod shape-determining protein MreD
MRPLFAALAGVAAFWLQVTVIPSFALFGVHPNLPLMTVALFGMRWLHPGFFVYAALSGLALDSFSHGVLGVYGISFLITAALANVAGIAIYEQNPLFTALAVSVLTLAEGLVSLLVLSLLGSEVAWASWLLGRVLPLSIYHGALTPFLFRALRRLESALRLTLSPS